MKPLWEVDHPYYCNLGNYTARGAGDLFYSWSDFLAAYANADLDLNLVFRWDWVEREDSTPGKGEVHIFWMNQRKGHYRFTIVEVTRSDEPEVLEFLRPRWEHLKKLWAPLSEEVLS